MPNDLCPITLEPLGEKSPQEVFVHADVGFDMLALYEYLVHAPQFNNPVNRIPFTLEQLEALEKQMETVFGADCILYTNNDEADSQNSLANDDYEDEDDSVPPSSTRVNWLDDTELISRLNTSITTVSTDSNARVIRLRVDIDLADAHVDDEDEAEETNNEEIETDEDEFSNIDQDSLPPRRTFPSVTDMYRDTGRQRRMSDQLALLQFLEYDAMNVLVQLMDMVYDDHFHRFVWQHTSLDVMDTVTTYLTDQEPEPSGNVYTHIEEPSPDPPSPADYDLEVVYTECWEIYRQVLIHTLEQRYADAAHDIFNIGTNDARALFACHRAHVRQRAREQEFDYEVVLEILQRVEQGIFNNTSRR